MKEHEPSKEAMEYARKEFKFEEHGYVWLDTPLHETDSGSGVLITTDCENTPEHLHDALARHLDTFAAEAVAGVRAKWKAQRASIVETLEEWEAAFSDQPEYQSAIGDVLAWLNGDMP